MFVSADGDTLVVRPASAVTPEEIDALRLHKTEILGILQAPAPAPVPEGLDQATVARLLIMSLGRSRGGASPVSPPVSLRQLYDADVLDELLRGAAARECGNPQAAIPIILARARVFRAQLDAAEPGPIPVCHVPDSPSPQPGSCVSCGDPIARGVRCVLCAMAARLVLGLAEPSPVPGFPQGEALEQAGQAFQRHLQTEAEAGRGVTRLAAEAWLEAHSGLSRRETRHLLASETEFLWREIDGVLSLVSGA